MRSSIAFSFRSTNGVSLHVADTGPPEGPLVVLLHGFPEFWYGWRRQIDPLAEAGLRVLVPDQRGYHLSARPHEVAAYDLDLLAADILGLAKGIGRRRFSVVGHDWGASVGWWIATRHADRVDRLIAVNAPHPAVWVQAMRTDPEQRGRSRYVSLFRIPVLPEFLMRRGNFKALVDALRESKRPDSWSDDVLNSYRAAWSISGALTGMVNWYRALLRKRLPDQPQRIAVPTRIIWGSNDKYAVRDLAERSLHLCDTASVEYLDASHWVQHDQPVRVAELICEFLRA
jgi:pimeloyl-ACP methyl ester carboxylesterase